LVGVHGIMEIVMKVQCQQFGMRKQPLIEGNGERWEDYVRPLFTDGVVGTGSAGEAPRECVYV